MSSYEARFGGISRLLGREGLERLQRAHVAVVGLGGVGSWAAEALARSGLGEVTLVDLDDVCISNTNRQLHAMEGEFGKPKVDVVATRIRAINPECVVHPVRLFFTRTTADGILQAGFDYVLDAIDSPSKKCWLIAKCRDKGFPVITSGGAAGRRDPKAVQITDLAFTSHDPLLQQVRRNLRVRDGFPRGHEPFNVACVYSNEAPVFPTSDGSVCSNRKPDADLRLDCDSGFGTASFVTGAFGLAAAGHIVCHLAQPGVPAFLPKSPPVRKE
jgi:tRNA threonylcarbamoyladenosine dehydratase